MSLMKRRHCRARQRSSTRLHTSGFLNNSWQDKRWCMSWTNSCSILGRTIRRWSDPIGSPFLCVYTCAGVYHRHDFLLPRLHWLYGSDILTMNGSSSSSAEKAKGFFCSAMKTCESQLHICSRSSILSGKLTTDGHTSSDGSISVASYFFLMPKDLFYIYI